MVSHPETGSDSPIGSDQDRGRDNEDAKWRKKETSNDARKNKRRMSQCSYCSQIQLICKKHTGAGPQPR